MAQFLDSEEVHGPVKGGTIIPSGGKLPSPTLKGLADHKNESTTKLLAAITNRLEQVLIRERCKDERINELGGIIKKLQNSVSSSKTDPVLLKVILTAGLFAGGHGNGTSTTNLVTKVVKEIIKEVENESL